MITSVFLLFVAAGISIAFLVYGFGGLFPLMIVLSLAAIVARATVSAVLRRAPETETT